MADLTTEHKALSDSIIRREALRFLHAQANALEAKLREWSAYLAEAYPSGRVPPGEAGVMDVYEEEKALVQELIGDCRDKLLPEAVRERSDAARRDRSKWQRNTRRCRCEEPEEGPQRRGHSCRSPGKMVELAEC